MIRLVQNCDKTNLGSANTIKSLGGYFNQRRI